MSERILIVDDEPTFCETFASVLHLEGFECRTASHAAAALKQLGEATFDIVFLDLHLPDSDGLHLLKTIGEQWPETFVIMITGDGRLETAIEAIRNGAFDYISKPLNFDEALVRVRYLIEHRDRMAEIRSLKREMRRQCDFEHLVGRTPEMLGIFDLVKRVVTTNSTVLITGESGTGKELIARAIHYNSELTRDRRFVAVNCAAIPEQLLESELFGHLKGSFTGSTADKKGLFEVAEGGSVFLDEIGEMNSLLQAKLLRAIEEREIVRVGGTDPIKINVRIICSTHRDLKQMVADRQFREDLYYRINVVEIRLPALRERREDISLLVSHFIQKYNKELKRAYQGVANNTMQALINHEWKGNVRELENVVERAMILGDGVTIRLKDLPPVIAGLTPETDPDSLRDALRAFERRHILRVLEKTNGDKEEASHRMGIGLSSLYRKIEELDMREVATHVRAKVN